MKTIYRFLLIALVIFPFQIYPQWIQQNLPGDIDVTLGIDFINQNHGVMGGWHINFGGQFVGNAFYTVDAGTNWIEAVIPDSMRVIVGIQMITDNISYGAGAYNQSIFQKTSNSNPPQSLNSYLRKYYDQLGLDFSGQEDYRGYFVETTDGGLSWHPKGSFEDSVYYLVGMAFFNQQTGFVIASRPSASSSAILKTTNGGDNWSYVYSFESGLTLKSIKFFNELEGIAVGTSSSIPGNAGIILITSNGGDSWMRSELPLLATIDDITYLNINSILISGVKTDFTPVIFRSDDGGNTWFECCYYSDLHMIIGINSLPTSGVIIVYGQYQPIGSAIPFIEATIDNGVTWDYNLLPQFPDYYLTKSKLVDESRWYLTGTQFSQMGFVLFTDNAGGVPVELTSFTAEVAERQVNLNWTTASELNNLGFEIERKSGNEEWRIIGFIDGKGTTTEIQNYSFIDNLFGVKDSKLFYRLKQIDFNGSFEYSEVVEIEIYTIEKLSLSQNYPNPFNPITKIKFSIPSVIASGAKQSPLVTLKVYDVLGNEIATLVREELPAGEYEVEFNATSLTTGIYFYQLKAGDYIQTKKMVYLK